MKKCNFIHFNLILVIGYIFFSACTHSAQSEKNKPNQISKNSIQKINKCLCPMIYLPVCGHDQKTYSNECHAKCAGVKFHQGTCEQKQNIKK